MLSSIFGSYSIHKSPTCFSRWSFRREGLNKSDEDFETLSLEDKKKALISLVDKSKLYVNYSDMEDQTFKVSKSDKIFTKSFYKEV